MLRLEVLQAEFSNPGIRKPSVAWRTVAERFIGNKPRCCQLPHIVKHGSIFADEFAMHVFGEVIAVYASLRDVFKRCFRLVANVHGSNLSKTMMDKYSAIGRERVKDGGAL